MARELEFGGVFFRPDVRMLHDMSDVVYDREWLTGAEDMELYYMYRDLALSEADRLVLGAESLRYDVTVIPALSLGCEFVKTAGHYHPELEGTGLSYTEVYEVLKGRAHYLLQALEGGRVVDVVLVKATEGDKVVIPPNYGHVTINPSDDELMMANLVSSRFSSVYDLFQKMRGGAYFELRTGEFIRNEHYRGLPDIRFLDAVDLGGFGINRDQSLYSLLEGPGVLGFLNDPVGLTDFFDFCVGR